MQVANIYKIIATIGIVVKENNKNKNIIKIGEY